MPYDYESSSFEAFPDTLPFHNMSDILDDELCSVMAGRRPEEKGIVAFVPDVKAWAVTVALVPQPKSAMLLGRKRNRVQSQVNDRRCRRRPTYQRP